MNWFPFEGARISRQIKETRNTGGEMSSTEMDILLELRNTPQIWTRMKELPEDEFQRQKILRSEFSEELVRAALTLADLRKKAAEKFRLADKMWLTRVGLEQSTSDPIAQHKATRFQGPIVDLCCGIGGDAMALKAKGPLVALDADPLICLRASWNLELIDSPFPTEVLHSDALAYEFEDRLVHIDPDRRSPTPGDPSQKRTGKFVRIDDYQPGLDYLNRLIETATGGAIKLSPAANFGGKFPGCEIELISWNGECKEATVWFGELAGVKQFRATLLPSGETISADPMEHFAELRPLEGYVYDPDPAVVRAGMVDAVAVQLALSRLDQEEEYLTSNRPLSTPFAQGFEVLADLPFDEKKLRAYFRSNAYGQIEIKCRHLKVDVDQLRKKISRSGRESCTLILSRIGAKSRALIAKRL